MSPDARPDRHALLELQGLLTQIGALRSEGNADRFTTDARYRWILHRLWIAAGNEALAYTLWGSIIRSCLARLVG